MLTKVLGGAAGGSPCRNCWREAEVAVPLHRGHLWCLGTLSVVTTGNVTRMRGQRPGLLLHSTQCTPSTETTIRPRMLAAPRPREPALRRNSPIPVKITSTYSYWTSKCYFCFLDNDTCAKFFQSASVHWIFTLGACFPARNEPKENLRLLELTCECEVGVGSAKETHKEGT